MILLLFKFTSIWQNNSLIIREFKYFYKIAFLALICSILAAIFEGIGLVYLLNFLQALLNDRTDSLKSGIQLIDFFLDNSLSPINQLYLFSALILLSLWMKAFFNYLTYIYTNLTELHFVNNLHKRIFEHLHKLKLIYFISIQGSEIINTITNEVNRLRQTINLWSVIFTKSFSLAIQLILIFRISWQLSLLLVLLFTLVGKLISKLNIEVRKASFSVSQANALFTSVAIQLIAGIRTVQLFSTQDLEQEKVFYASKNVVNTSAKTVFLSAVVRPFIEIVGSTILIVIILLAITVNKELSTSKLLTFMFILFRVISLLSEISGIIAIISNLSGSVEKIKSMLSTDTKYFFINGQVKFTGLKDSIEFVSVNFSYALPNFVLNDITLAIDRGKMTALVGASGAGKSTLVDLISRLYDPTQGKVLIDGIDLQNFEIDSVRQKMGVVSQDVFIFNSSVRDNIAYGIEDADETAIWEAARLANAFDFILDLPEGFETELGDRGVRLSGGQRQRIALARVFLRNPEILILDEATSALDSVSERLIQEALERVSQGRTVIAIAHRLSTIMRANNVVVLEAGRIVEEGTYQELLKKRGALWRYHQMQELYS